MKDFSVRSMQSQEQRDRQDAAGLSNLHPHGYSLLRDPVLLQVRGALYFCCMSESEGIPYRKRHCNAEAVVAPHTDESLERASSAT